MFNFESSYVCLKYGIKTLLPSKAPGHNVISAIFLKKHCIQYVSQPRTPILQIVQGDMTQLLQQLNMFLEDDISMIAD